MAIDSMKVRQLRLERAWSQEHLAALAGLSLRTIQRVETEGSGSLETRMALASALAVPAAALGHGYSNATTTGAGYLSFLQSFPGKPVGIVFAISFAVFGILNGWMGLTGIAAPHGSLGTWLGATCAIAGLVANRYQRAPDRG